MEFGLNLLKNYLTAGVCFWFLCAVIECRPSSDSSEASDWSAEWQEVANLWKPKADKDKWRAFEPEKDVSTSRWWEQKLDDNLWSQNEWEASTKTPENTSSSKSQPIATSEPVPAGDEKTITNMSPTEIKHEVTQTTTTMVRDSEPRQPLFKAGEVNAFIEPDPGVFYRSSGESYGKYILDSSNSGLNEKKDDTKKIEGNKSNDLKKNKNSSAIENKHLEKGNAGHLLHDYSKEDQELSKKLRESVDKDASDAGKALHSQDTTAGNSSQAAIKLDENIIPLAAVPMSGIVATSSKGDKENQVKNLLINSQNLKAPAASDGKTKPQDGAVDKKASEPKMADANAIYGKGERLAVSHTGAVNSVVIENSATNRSTELKEEVIKKPSIEFSDFDNWNNSAFDYYDDQEAEKENQVSDKKGTSSLGSDESFQSDSPDDFLNDEGMDDDDDDDDDDYYDSNDEDKNDSNFEDDKAKIKLASTTTSPVHINNNKISKSETQKESDIKQQTDEVSASNADIYKSNYPNHKPSVKKDLTNPANVKKEVFATSKSQDYFLSKSIEIQNVSARNDLSVSHEKPYSKSEDLTNSNPQPLGLKSDKKVTGKLAPNAIHDSSSHSINLALENLDNSKSEVNNGFILSFPLEFCKVDSECRAGRTCMIGVCRCYTPSMCVGHYKPVCGSDGFLYPSHCELHRVACVNRVHIRADRKGKCFQKEIEEKEKGWLMEQEKFQQENGEKHQTETKKVVKDLSHDVVEKDSTTSVTTDKSTTATVANGKKECTWKEMGEFKEALLMHYCEKFTEPNCKLEVKTDREYLSMLMFSYCDKDYDYYLTAKELDDKERDEHFANNFTINCHLHDFIKYADNLETDGKLTVSEFTTAFNMPIPSPPLHANIEVVLTLATAGNGLELKCGVDAANIVWKRHGAQLSDDKRSHQLMVFEDGALFFSTIGLHHIGNYTCMDADDESKAQIHRLNVQTLPVVEVMPAIQTHVTGSDIELMCHAEGVPKPVITWKLGGEVLQNSPHTIHYYDGGHIVIHNAQLDSDAGTYTCSAHSQAGTTEKSVSVHVLPLSGSLIDSTKEAGTFVVFHAKGISAYDPLQCLLRHQIPGDFSNFKFIPDALDSPLTLCRKEQDCQWKEAVKVGSEYIYVGQPDQNRVVVMNSGDTWNPLQVIDTDKKPEKLWYVKHLDQVWVLCGNQEQGDTNKTVVVIRDASQHIQHRSVHTQPVGNHFDLVQDLFIAPSNDLEHEFAFGYVSHRGQNGLFKLSLNDMSYTKVIDLTNYGCVPTNIAFVPIGGHVVIQCVSAADQHTLQLIMDYLTDTITSTTSLNGFPMTSPDSRHLVTVDRFTGKVIVTSVSNDGVLETTYEVTVSASISDVAFMPAMSHQGYDLVLTSADDDDVIIMNLMTGKVEKIPGSQYSDPTRSWHPSPKYRHIISGNSMSNYLMAPSRSSLAILDAKFKQVECEFLETVNSEVMIYIPSSYNS